MLGAIVGDIVGSVYEWHNIDTLPPPVEAGTLVPGSATAAMFLRMALHNLPGRNFGRVIAYLRGLAFVYNTFRISFLFPILRGEC